MKNKKTLESLKSDLFDLTINSNAIAGGGSSDSTWWWSAKEQWFDYSNDGLKPEPIFKITS